MPRAPDWHCDKCNMKIFGSKPACAKCGTPNPGLAAATAPSAPARSAPAAAAATPASSESSARGRSQRLPDWHCPKCGDLVFGSRPACRQCGTANPAAAAPGAAAATPATAAAPEARPAPTQRLPDWHCASCNMSIFGSKPACAKCGAANPGLASAMQSNPGVAAARGAPTAEQTAALAALDARVGVLPPWYWDIDGSFPTPGRTSRRAVSDPADLAALQEIMTTAHKVKRAWWLQGDTAWVQYATTRSLMPPSAKDGTSSVLTARTMRGPLEKWSTVLTTHAPCNEMLLLHGTKPEAVGVISQAGFDERVCRLSGLFGAGLYFTDVPAKAHSYTSPDGQGTRFMFLARVCMGRFMFTTKTRSSERRPPDGFDSVVGQPGTGAAREFVVYDRRMTYPEILIEYS